jgi:hypothetical protein
MPTISAEHLPLSGKGNFWILTFMAKSSITIAFDPSEKVPFDKVKTIRSLLKRKLVFLFAELCSRFAGK